MKVLLSVDEWLLSQYQKAADWCYSEWDVSPYKIAAQCFALAVIVSVVSYGLGASLFGLVLVLISNTLWFWLAIWKDKLWTAKRMPITPSPFDMGLRMMFLSLFSLSIWHVGYCSYTDQLSLRDVIRLAEDMTAVCAYYFFGCKPPTYIERRDHKLVPVSGR